MVAAISIVLIMVALTLLELPSMIRKKQKKDIWVFITLMVLATGLAAMHALGFKIPNPVDFIVKIYKPIDDWLKNLLS